MAEIISLSLSQELKDELDNVQSAYGFSGRSEAIRAGLRMLLAEGEELPKGKDVREAMLLVVHPEKSTQDVFHVLHQHEGLVKTQLHQHLNNHKCLEVFFVSGQSDKIRALVKKLRIQKNMEMVKLIPL